MSEYALINRKVPRALWQRVTPTMDVFEFVRGDERLGLKDTEYRLNAYHKILKEIAEGQAWENPPAAARRFLDSLERGE